MPFLPRVGASAPALVSKTLPKSRITQAHRESLCNATAFRQKGQVSKNTAGLRHKLKLSRLARKAQSIGARQAKWR